MLKYHINMIEGNAGGHRPNTQEEQAQKIRKAGELSERQNKHDAALVNYLRDARKNDPDLRVYEDHFSAINANVVIANIKWHMSFCSEGERRHTDYLKSLTQATEDKKKIDLSIEQNKRDENYARASDRLTTITQAIKNTYTEQQTLSAPDASPQHLDSEGDKMVLASLSKARRTARVDTRRK